MDGGVALQAGSYTVTYSATDKAGNVGSASRTVTVVSPCSSSERFCSATCRSGTASPACTVACAVDQLVGPTSKHCPCILLIFKPCSVITSNFAQPRAAQQQVKHASAPWYSAMQGSSAHQALHNNCRQVASRLLSRLSHAYGKMADSQNMLICSCMSGTAQVHFVQLPCAVFSVTSKSTNKSLQTNLGNTSVQHSIAELLQGCQEEDTCRLDLQQKDRRCLVAGAPSTASAWRSLPSVHQPAASLLQQTPPRQSSPCGLLPPTVSMPLATLSPPSMLVCPLTFTALL